jgi:hypothetical protein
MALKPLRSVGRISSAIDPSQLSSWQFRTLLRTQPDAPLTKRATAHRDRVRLARSMSHGALRTSASSSSSSSLPVAGGMSEGAHARGGGSTQGMPPEAEGQYPHDGAAAAAAAAAMMPEGQGGTATAPPASSQLRPKAAKVHARRLGALPRATGDACARSLPDDDAPGAYGAYPFPERLLSKLEGVPGMPLQALRLMRRGDWRCKG